jgi:hypothetical protein
VPGDVTGLIRETTAGHLDAGTTWVPVDVLTTTKGQRFALSGGLATHALPFSTKPPVQYACWRIDPLPPILATTRSGSNELCNKQTLQVPTEGSVSDRYWSQPHNLGYYPPIPGDSIIEDERFRFAYGVAAPEVHYVVGIDADGHRHKGRIVGRELGWKVQLYTFVAEKSVTFVKFKAYSQTGELLSSMDPECPGPCKAPN